MDVEGRNIMAGKDFKFEDIGLIKTDKTVLIQYLDENGVIKGKNVPIYIDSDGEEIWIWADLVKSYSKK